MFLFHLHYYTIILIFTCKYRLIVCNPIDHENIDDEQGVTIEVLEFKADKIPYGHNVTLICKSTRNGSAIFWIFNDTNITDNENSFKLENESENIKLNAKQFEVSILHILNMNVKHTGAYVCNSHDKEIDIARVVLNVTLPIRIVHLTQSILTKINTNVELNCTVDGYPIETLHWLKDNTILPNNLSTILNNNVTQMQSSLRIDNITKQDNGTYTCAVFDSDNGIFKLSTAILVLDKPQVRLDFVKAIGTNTLYFNWTLNDGNSPQSLNYTLQYNPENDSKWIFYPMKLNGSRTSYVMKEKFHNNTKYMIRLKASNSEGDSQYSQSDSFKMPNEELVFRPKVEVNGVTTNSMTIRWLKPNEHVQDNVHYYNLMITSNNQQNDEKIVYTTGNEELYMFSNLEPATMYKFKVAACSNYSGDCGEWSNEATGTTMDGVSGPPSNVTVHCRFDNASQTSVVFVTWSPPVKPKGTVQSYKIHLTGAASYVNDLGDYENTTFGPQNTTAYKNHYSVRMNNVSANTNYTIEISAVTQIKKDGEVERKHCTMMSVLPDKQKLSTLNWQKINQQGKWLFKLTVPRISERNGPICCYIIYVVRLARNQKLSDLPIPENLPIVTYQEAHAQGKKSIAYIAEMFTNNDFHTEVVLGDNHINSTTNQQCNWCLRLRQRHIQNAFIPDENPKANIHFNIQSNDGIFDIDKNYTVFMEILVYKNHTKTSILSTYSEYLHPLNAGPEVYLAPTADTVTLVLQILCGIMFIILLALTGLCIAQHYNKHPNAQPEIAFRASLRHLYRHLRGRQRLISITPPDICPINKNDLLSAYLERHRDSDYGFQQEFELLPDKFPDRSTRASDMRENLLKNRYPDIKAFDQTRVKISQTDSIIGSDYINANYVIGFKERKKFICAQGPMDATVNDFWRMIWEQHLELVLMLTNLEEHSKTKCTKYWPDKSEGDKVYGDIVVTHMMETRYSDYVVRQLKIAKNYQGKVKEERQITQYHYLVWKDFSAPEYPNGIIKFIKRIHEAYSIEKGCILIHCSAGVGRTGTLVALDSLLQQLKEEGQVAIFNTICDLRHQRNFLVQSLEQYIFVYRALAESALYTDAEIDITILKTTIEKLKQCDKNSNKTPLEQQFETILRAYQENKSASVGCNEYNLTKNRCESIVAYDKNRVILTPLIGQKNSSYINASFIEGYDNTESFIIAQDPLESTINDFWRMISEQRVSVVVMLSEIGDSKCPRYWPEDEEMYDQISVRYIQAESCPYYTRREIFVKGRDGDELKVVHLQYHGWPTVDGEVPEVTRGLIELVDHAQISLVHDYCTRPMIVHCNKGTDRSSMFVGLSILVQQLRIEKRVDLFAVTRKLRSQRIGLINSYAQYEFLHRAIVNYAELRGLCE